MNYQACVLYTLFLVSLDGTSALAPGDEDSICLDPRETATYRPPPDTTRVLMNSRYYEDPLGDLVWTTLDVDGDGQTWRYSTGGRCTRTVRSCSWRNPGQENWLVTQYISKNISQERDTYPVTILIDIDWRISSCTDACNRMIEVHRFLSNSEQFPDVSQRVGTSLETITSPVASLARTASMSFTLGVNQEGFYLGFLATGTCFTINQINVYRLRCPPMQVGLALYPDTHTPISGQVQVNAGCVEGASGDGSLSLTCDNTGQWTGNPTCSCDCGYLEISDPPTCRACEAGTYRSLSDRTCQTCPANTDGSEVRVCECPCLPGFFRAASEGTDTGCTSPPGQLSCGEPTVTSNSIALNWQRPETGRSDFYYRVNYTNLDDPDGETVVVFRSSTLSVSRTVTGLSPFTVYHIQVSVHNGVSNQDLENARKRVCTFVETTDEGSPRPPANIHSLCTAVVWAPPEQPNGVIVGYTVQFRRSGTTTQPTPTERGPSELFVVIEGDSIPPGQGDLEFRVRARNSQNGQFSPWTALGDGCPEETVCTGTPSTDTTTAEPPTTSTCPTLTCPTTPTEPAIARPGQITTVDSFNCETIVWEPPANTGGEITGYTVRVYYKVGGSRTDPSTTEHTISNPKHQWLHLAALPDTKPLYYQVKAKNSVGESDHWSDERELTDPIDCPPAVIVRPGRVDRVSVMYHRMLSWSPPESTGGEITSYNVRVYYYYPAGPWKFTVSSHTLKREWMMLSRHRTRHQLYVQVRARNSAGVGRWSHELPLASQ